MRSASACDRYSFDTSDCTLWGHSHSAHFYFTGSLLVAAPHDKQSERVAFTAMGLGILVGWLGALWARAARPVVKEPPGLNEARRSFLSRGRAAFAPLFGLGAAIGGPFVPELSVWPIWGAVLSGAVVGALAGA